MWCPRIVGARWGLGIWSGEVVRAQCCDGAGVAQSDDLLRVVVRREGGTMAGSAQIVSLDDDEHDSNWVLAGAFDVFCVADWSDVEKGEDEPCTSIFSQKSFP